MILPLAGVLSGVLSSSAPLLQLSRVDPLLLASVLLGNWSKNQPNSSSRSGGAVKPEQPILPLCDIYSTVYTVLLPPLQDVSQTALH